MAINSPFRAPWLLGVLAAVCSTAGLAAVPPVFTIQDIGLRDPAHVNAAGRSESYAGWAEPSSWGFGGAAVFLGLPQEYGATAFAHDLTTGTTFPIGLLDVTHTLQTGTLTGRQFGYVLSDNAHGYAAGISGRFVGGTDPNWPSGHSTWLFDPNTRTTRQIGFVDAVHTASDGRQHGETREMNDGGYLTGYSVAYDGGPDQTGVTAWVYSISTGQIRSIGLFDSTHVAPSGRSHNEPVRFDERGYAVGRARRFIDGNLRGESAWLHDVNTESTSQIGLFDDAHTASDGSQYTFANLDYAGLNTGLILGYSQRRVGYERNSTTAWTLDPQTGAFQIYQGLSGAPFVTASGYRASYVNDVSVSGFATGSSARYTTAEARAGVTNWLYVPTSQQYIPLGFLGPDYTEPVTGRQENSVTRMNEAGQVIGRSIYRPEPNSSLAGGHAWFYDHSAGVTRMIGLFYDDVTPERWQNTTWDLNEAGQGIGWGTRFVNGVEKGTAGWFYDNDTNATTPLVFSQRSDGFAYSLVTDIAENGTVAGFYQKFMGMDDLGQFAFLWSMSDGFVELGSMVDGGLSAHGWQRLSYLGYLADGDLLFGTGVRLDGSLHAFAMIPTIPEPASTLVALALCRRRRASRWAR